jgi:hypothetical protein
MLDVMRRLENKKVLMEHPTRLEYEVLPMRNLLSIRRTVQSALLAVAVWMGCEAMVLAKDTPGGASTTEGGGAWVVAYMIVLLVVSLGLIVVCKSSGRRDRAKPEVYSEAKVLPKE